MPLEHTPRKTTIKATETSPNNPTMDSEKAGPSPKKVTLAPNVRKSIGEWENNKSTESKTAASTTFTVSPGKLAQVPTAPSRPNQRVTLPSEKVVKRRGSVEAASGSPKLIATTDRVHEGRIWLLRAKTHLNESRNLRSDLKAGLTMAVETMYKLIKDGAAEAGTKIGYIQEVDKSRSIETREILIQKDKRMDEDQIIQKIEENNRLLIENGKRIEELKIMLEGQKHILEKSTYASVAAAGPKVRTTLERTALHSVVITSGNEMDTGEEVLEKVRKAVEAKEGWIKVEKVRKAKDRKIIVGCETKEERRKIKEKIENAGIHLIVEEVRNRDPLLILKDVLLIHSDEDVRKALRNQNQEVFQGLDKEEDRMTIKYRKKARNQHTGHIVLTVSPKIWQRALELGKMRVDLQKIHVEDQSPLVQCTKCLGYGHGRRFCKESEDVCSHCGGLHFSKECPDKVMKEEPECINCKRAKLENRGHNAFSSICPVRRKWDDIARASISYC